ncbi:MAG: hypothetical protein ACOYI2_09610, partial [Bacillota bacterium]
MEINQKNSWFDRGMITVLRVLFFVLILNLALPASVLAASDSLEITGDGVTHPVTFTLEELA